MNNRPKCSIVEKVAEKYLNNIISIEPIYKGASTYVYRIATKSKIYYIRFLPEDASFATEVLVHNTLYNAGVKVPKVIEFEDKNSETGLSVMLVDEIPGVCIEDSPPQSDFKDILNDAGRQLALIHSIPVDGFGWIDKKSHNTLRGENQSFAEYFNEYLKSDLLSLNQYPFTNKEKILIKDLMIKARKMLDIEKAVLVHGDFDISHIFHTEGSYSGIIDFGEIRGNNRLYDLATFIGFYQDRELFSFLLQGYYEISPLTDNDLYATELMALFIILRFLGKKVSSKYREHWYNLSKKQLNYILSLKD